MSKIIDASTRVAWTIQPSSSAKEAAYALHTHIEQGSNLHNYDSLNNITRAGSS